MSPSRAGPLRRARLTFLALAFVTRLPLFTLVPLIALLALVGPRAVAGEECPPVLDWETGEGKSFAIPGLEIGGFIFGLNQFDRHVYDRETYDTDLHTSWKNLRSSPVFDKDPFSINQLGHPYQGNIYYGFARSAGLNYWQSLLYTIGGSFLWETYGETTRPSVNDHIASGIAGTFVGEAMFRMASLLLEGGGESPGFWRELGAALLSPPTGFNRLVFGDRFKPVFPSRDPEVFVRLRLGATVTTSTTNAGLTQDVKEQEGSADYSITYGCPASPAIATRARSTTSISSSPRCPTPAPWPTPSRTSRFAACWPANATSGATTTGACGASSGTSTICPPQIFRVSNTAISLGTVSQWWLSRAVALQTTALGGLGLGAAGTVADREERDYHYGLVPHALVGLRLIFGGRAMLEATARQFYVAGTGSKGGVTTNHFGQEIIARENVGFTVRIYGPHAPGIQYLVTTRDAHFPDLRDRHQSVETVSLSYNFLGHTRFGATEWRPDVAAGR